MKIEINIMPWYMPLLIDLPKEPSLGMYIELNESDLNRYISLIKAGDYSYVKEIQEDIDNAPATLADDEEDYWEDLYTNNEVKEVNIVWNSEANAYVLQAVLGRPYYLDMDDDEGDEEDSETA